MTNKNILEKCREYIGKGMKHEDIIKFLSESDLSPIEAIKIYKKLYNLSIGESKEKVMSHPAWRSHAKSGDDLHEEILEILKHENPDID